MKKRFAMALLLAVAAISMSFSACALIVQDANGNHRERGTRFDAQGNGIRVCVPLHLDHQPPDPNP